MGCKKCKKSSCSGSCGESISDIKNELAELRDLVNNLNDAAKFLTCGHPILMIENQDDIDQFNMDTGLGEECWEGWALCNGDVQYSNNAEKNITTPNLLDRFIVGAGDTYEVGDTGGANEVTLSTAEMPVHTHVVTDPGHDHTIEDPGHTHGTAQTAHTHVASGGAHVHAVDLETSEDGNHEHSAGTGVNIEDTGTEIVVRLEDAGGASTSSNGLHTHTVTGNTASAASTVSVTAASISITVQDAFTGITETEDNTTGITIANTGEGDAHENRPPFYALIFIIKL